MGIPKGITYEEFYGPERAKEIKEKISESVTQSYTEDLKKRRQLTTIKQMEIPEQREIRSGPRKPEFGEKIRKQIKKHRILHDDIAITQIKNFEKQGFRCVPIGLKKHPHPDFIAIKNDKVYAVEVELSGKINITSGAKKGYELFPGIYDDIFWILPIRKRGKKIMWWISSTFGEKNTEQT